MKHAILAIMIILVAGCASMKPPPTAVPESCDLLCRTPCDVAAPTWKPVDARDTKAWDTYPKQVTLPLLAKLDSCELKRQTCVQCLDRLKEAGVTK